jgi:LPS-assembly lipoprotein
MRRRVDFRRIRSLSRALRVAAIVGVAGLTAGCWQPLYGSGPTPDSAGVQDKFAAVDIPPITAPKGTPVARLAVSLRNALQFDLHNGRGSAFAPIYQLKATIASGQVISYVNPNTGLLETSIENLTVYYQLLELATGKQVLSDTAYAHVDYAAPGSQQRFARQRALLDAENQAVEEAAQMMRNRLASYFVAGT